MNKMNEINTKIENVVDKSEDEIFVIVTEDNNEGIENKGDNEGSNKINNIYEGNVFEPRKDQFNYLKVNIENEKNRDIKEAIKSFIDEFEKKIKKKYEENDEGKKINVNIFEKKDYLFKIKFEIPPMFVDNDDIVFLDEKFEKKIKNKYEFEIKVEFIEGDKSLFLNYNINQYFLIFTGNLINKEDFYEHLTILKDIAKKVLKNEDDYEEYNDNE